MDVLRQLSTKLRFSLELKVEQREALNSLLDGSDVLAVLPTGYGKSLIFQLLVLVGKEERRRPAAVLVICPLKSIIDNQIGEAEGLGIRADAINDVSSDYLRSGKLTLSFPARADWIRLDRSRAAGFRGGTRRTIGCV